MRRLERSRGRGEGVRECIICRAVPGRHHANALDHTRRWRVRVANGISLGNTSARHITGLAPFAGARATLGGRVGKLRTSPRNGTVRKMGVRVVKSTEPP